jgi:hypothetical protein
VKARAVVEFVTGASLAAAVGACALAAWAAGSAASGSWASAGFGAVALPAIAGGAWLVLEHGRPGTRFLTAFGAGIASRVLGAAIVLALSIGAGGAARNAAVAGLAFAFVPVMAFELAWFARGTVVRERDAEALR